MAGDIPGDELVFIAAGTTGDDDAGGSAGLRPDPTAIDTATPAGLSVEPGRVIHRYGRVSVVARGDGAVQPFTARPSGDDLTGQVVAGVMAAEAVAEDVRASLTDAERLGLDALALRDSADYHAAKDDRPRAGEPWNMGVSCVDIVPTPPPGGISPLVAAGGPDAAPTVPPTSSYLEGSVAVGIIIVEGPTADLQFSAAERTKVVAEVQNGLSFYATTNPPAEISFSYDIQIVRVNAAPQPTADDLEAVWRDPAMASLGQQANFDGVYTYVSDLRTRLRTNWSYAAFFTKYPVKWFAYSSIGGPRLVIQYANNGWGPDNIDRVFAHETGHIFGAVDEYTDSGCDCDGQWGRFGAPNGNCASCAANSLTCLMKGNDFALCRFTPAHIGWARGVTGNPALVQSRLGNVGNFEVVVPSAFSGIDHIWRNNDTAGTPWQAPFQTAWAQGPVNALTMIFSNLANPGSLEVVARYGATLSFLWRDGGPAFRWRAPAPIASGASGVPSLIQGRNGRAGNFEFVSPAAAGGLFHLFRDNDLPARPWSRPTAFGASLGQVDAVSMIQSNIGGGSLEVVARIGSRLVHVYRTPAGAWKTTSPIPVVDGVTGNPSLVQSRFGQIGNFEVVSPAVAGGLVHVWRDNDQADFPWQTPTFFGQSLGTVDAVSMIQSNLGGGSLEVQALAAGRLYHFWREAAAPYAWHGPTRVL